MGGGRRNSLDFTKKSACSVFFGFLTEDAYEATISNAKKGPNIEHFTPV